MSKVSPSPVGSAKVEFSLMNLANQVAVVTGASRGIGRAIAQGFLDSGANVLLVDREGAPAAAAELDPDQQHVRGLTLDIAEENAGQTMVAAACSHFGRIDTLVNNAGMYASLSYRAAVDLPSDEWHRVFDVNVFGTFAVTAAVITRMQEQGSGSIINLASHAPLKGAPMQAHYVSSKGAVIALTRALARELGGGGIRVNAVAPGFTLSEGVLGNPDKLAAAREVARNERCLKRDSLPADIVGPVLFLASAHSAFMTGQTLVVDGGAVFV